jgi:hypothetical protein
VRQIKGNQEKVLLWDNGGAGEANFEFINSTQIAKYKLFSEKKGLSSTKHFINAILKKINGWNKCCRKRDRETA